MILVTGIPYAKKKNSFSKELCMFAIEKRCRQWINNCYEVQQNEKCRIVYNNWNLFTSTSKNLLSGSYFLFTFLKSTILRVINRTRICQKRWWMLWCCIKVCLIWRWTAPKRVDITHTKFALFGKQKHASFWCYSIGTAELNSWVYMGRTMEIADKHRKSAGNNDNNNAVSVSMTSQNEGMRFWNGKDNVK